MNSAKTFGTLASLIGFGVATLFHAALCRAGESVWVADLDLANVQQEWGTPQRDRSVDKKPMTLAGKLYEHGLGTHAASRLMIDVGGAAKRLTAVVGIDDDAGQTSDPVVFRVLGDGRPLWTSNTQSTGADAQNVDVDVSGITILQLRVDKVGDGIRYAHADWALARLEYSGRKPLTIPILVPPAAILTPPAPAEPRITGATVFGVRPGSPVLYTITATGDRPMRFSADNLPAGVSVDEMTGRLTGAVAAAGEYAVVLHAVNTRGKAVRTLRLLVGDTLALTPPMGWNSWNCWGEEVDGEKVLRSARALVSSGLINHGWTYVNIDDAWQGARGGEFNAIQPDPKKFPDMKALCDKVHAMGLKVGIYSSPWIETYGGRIGGSADNAVGKWVKSNRKAAKNNFTKPYAIGQYSFASNDAKQWAAWGIDYLKYDWGPVDVKSSAEMNDALRASGRDIVYSLSNNAVKNILGILGDLAPTANAWRTTNDINDTWGTMSGIGFAQDDWAKFQQPGRYNDADMLVVGHVGWGRPHPTKLTPDEQYTHVSLWCLLGSPLLIGCDLEKLDPFTLNLLTNDEVLDVNQDPLCRQATCVARQGDVRVYMKPLQDGSKAVGLFNVGFDEASCAIRFSDLKIAGSQVVRDLWRQKDVGTYSDEFTTTVASHGVVLLRINPDK